MKFHVDLDYSEFYSVMQSMDIVVPAFVNYDCTFMNINLEKSPLLILQLLQDFDVQASSTVVMAVECNVSRTLHIPTRPKIEKTSLLLLLRFHFSQRRACARHMDTSTTKGSPSLVPQALRDIPAIAAFRAGRYSPVNATSMHVEEFMFDVDDMLRRGWRKDT